MKNDRDPNSFVSCSGDRYRTIYSPVVQSDGTILLKESGKEDIQQMIDSYRDQTDMTFILERIKAGDTSMFREDSPMFGDFTSMPKNYAEFLQLYIDKEKQFLELPLDVRNSFDNDFRKWFVSSGSEDWFTKMEPVIIKEEKEIEKDVSE